MIFKDYYKILGLENTKITQEELKTAFREQAKKYHPDVNGGNPKTEERFKDINEAYRILSSLSSKRKYDRSWNNYVGKKQDKVQSEKTSMGNEFINMFFGNNKTDNNKTEPKEKKKLAIKGENIDTEINVGIEDAYYGVEKKISLRTVNGKMKTFNVKIPSGIRNGEKIRLVGQGKSGKNGGKNGDMFIKINIKNNERFKLQGYDIVTDLFLAPWEAALGKRVNVETMDDQISIYVPPGIQSGEKIKIPQKGYKDGRGSRGDLIAEVKTVVPKQLTEEEKELFERLKYVSKFNPRGTGNLHNYSKIS